VLEDPKESTRGCDWNLRRPSWADARDVIICPFRLLERKKVFTDCLHLLTMNEPGNELHLLSEVSIPGGHVD
jgi:hypothetical protein